MVLRIGICVGLGDYGRNLEHGPGDILRQRVPLLIPGHECCWTTVGHIGS